MPNRDKTGPEGEGPATGRGEGPCISEKQRDILSKLLGFPKRLGLGRKNRRGRRGRLNKEK